MGILHYNVRGYIDFRCLKYFVSAFVKKKNAPEAIIRTPSWEVGMSFPFPGRGPKHPDGGARLSLPFLD